MDGRPTRLTIRERQNIEAGLTWNGEAPTAASTTDAMDMDGETKVNPQGTSDALTTTNADAQQASIDAYNAVATTLSGNQLTEAGLMEMTRPFAGYDASVLAINAARYPNTQAGFHMLSASVVQADDRMQAYIFNSSAQTVEQGEMISDLRSDLVKLQDDTKLANRDTQLEVKNLEEKLATMMLPGQDPGFVSGYLLERNRILEARNRSLEAEKVQHARGMEALLQEMQKLEAKYGEALRRLDSVEDIVYE